MALIAAFCILGTVSLLGAPANAAMDVAWYFTPVFNDSLYGYDQANNESYTSSRLPAGVTAKREDGMNALFITKATELSLGDFNGTCLSNPSLCDDGVFTVSFFVKAKHITQQSLLFFDSGIRVEGYGWNFMATNQSQTSWLVGLFQPSASSNLIRDRLPTNGSWVHVTFVSHSGGSPKFYLNGRPSTGAQTTSVPSKYKADLKTNLTVGWLQNDNGFYVAFLQFIEKEVKPEDVGEHYRQSLVQAGRNFSVGVKFLVSPVDVLPDAGVAKLLVERTGDLQLPSSVRYQTSDGSAKAPRDYIAQPDGELVFKPGEVYKEIEIQVNPGAQLNTAFSVELKGHEDPPVEVKPLGKLSRVSVRIGFRPTDPPAGSAGVRDQMPAGGLLASLVFVVIICLYG